LSVVGTERLWAPTLPEEAVLVAIVDRTISKSTRFTKGETWACYSFFDRRFITSKVKSWKIRKYRATARYAQLAALLAEKGYDGLDFTSRVNLTFQKCGTCLAIVPGSNVNRAEMIRSRRGAD
jgi:hypothetical protein